MENKHEDILIFRILSNKPAHTLSWVLGTSGLNPPGPSSSPFPISLLSSSAQFLDNYKGCSEF